VDEELVFGKSLCGIEVRLGAGGVEDFLGAGLEGCFELGNQLAAVMVDVMD
jgi:hypothetical protein